MSVAERQATSDEFGAFRLQDVPVGKISVRATKGERAGSTEITLAPNDVVVTLQITIEPSDPDNER